MTRGQYSRGNPWNRARRKLTPGDGGHVHPAEADSDTFPDPLDGIADRPDPEHQLSDLRSRLAEKQATLDSRTAQVRRLQAAVKKLRIHARAEPYEAHLQRTSRFAHGVLAGGLVGHGSELIVAHDNLALLAANAIRSEHSRLIYDAVEIPDMAERSGAAALRYAEDPAGRQTIIAAEWPIIRTCDAVITVSPGLADWLGTRFPHVPITLVRNTRNPAQRRPGGRSIRNECALDANERLIVYQNTPFEGATEALDCLASLPNSCRLAFAGCDPASSAVLELKDHSASLGLSERVSFLGLLEADELVPFLSGADLAVIPFSQSRLNLRYSLPNRLFEAIAAGVPVIVPDGGDMAQLVSANDCGLVYGTTQHPTLADAVKAVLESQKELVPIRSRLTWDAEESKLSALIGQPARSGRALLLANKPITRNDRIRRIATTLLANGWNLTVAARTLPSARLKMSGVHYEQVELG